MARLSDSTHTQQASGMVAVEKLTLTSESAKTAYRAITQAGENPFEDYALPQTARRKAYSLTIPGVQRIHFNQIIEASILAYALSSGLNPNISSDVIADMTGRPVSEISKVVRSKEYHEVLTLRGMRVGDPNHLSGDQMRALSVMVDVSKHMTLERRLKSAGITWDQWQQWMRNPIFKAHHDQLSAQVFKSAQATIDSQVASGALDGKLDFIKYYNELSGKHDPNRRAHADVQLILDGIVEIITRNVTDRDTLMRISSELSLVVAKLG